MLWATAQAEGYPSAVWATYRQWGELGTRVRKGEQSSPVVSGRRSTITWSCPIVSAAGARQVPLPP